jgi:NADH-quinone oxidoreductase subunit C
MNQEEIKEKISLQFGEDVIGEGVPFRDQVALSVPAQQILEICRFLKEDPELAFDFLSFVGGVDRYPGAPRFEVIYQLYSLKHNHRFRIKALLPEPDGGQPAIDSVTSLWPTANWHERETSEMFGITFLNHPDPRKLLMPDNWKIHPLRKDFPLEGTEADTPDLPA